MIAEELTEALYEIVRYGEEQIGARLLDERVKMGVVILARLIESALAVVAAEKPMPTTEELWDSAIGVLHIRLGTYHSHKTLSREYLLRQIPPPILTALLVANRKRPKFHPALRDRLNGYLLPWLGDDATLLEIYRTRIENPAWIITEAYRSPREIELDRISRDPTTPHDERVSAVMQIGRIEAKRSRDEAKRGLGGRSSSVSEIVAWSVRDRRLSYRPECKAHNIRACSQCSRGRRDRRDLKARYEKLARVTGYEPAALMAPFRPGRQSAAEKQRGIALVGVVTALARDRFTQEAIGSHIDRSQERVNQMIQGSANYLSNRDVEIEGGKAA